MAPRAPRLAMRAIPLLLVLAMLPTVAGPALALPALCEHAAPDGAPDPYEEPRYALGCAAPGVGIRIVPHPCWSDHWSDCGWDFGFSVHVCASEGQLVDVAWARQASGDAGHAPFLATRQTAGPCPYAGAVAVDTQAGLLVNVFETIHVSVVTSHPLGGVTGARHETFLFDN